MTLRDNDARLAGVMFRGDAARLPIEPEAGWRVVVRGTVTVFERRGSLQIRVRDLRLEDERGLRQIAIDRLREQLRHEGLLDVHGKRPIPPYPERIGILTSVHGAALQDVLSVLARRWPCAEVVVYPARVQGHGSENDIARMTRGVSPHRVDVLIVTRGGGSVDDLWPFNTETVVRAIAGCRVPTITAVGHETDFTIADLMSDLRTPTPSAAAEMVAPERASVIAMLGRLRRDHYTMLDHIVDRHWGALRESRNQLRTGLTSSLRVMEERLARTRPDHLLAQVEARLRVTEDVIRAAHPSVHAAAVRITPASVSQQLVTSGAPVLRRDLERTVDGSDRTLKSLQPSVLGRPVSGLADRASTHLLGAAAELRALSPDATLRRGYTIPLSLAGRVLRQFGLTR